MHRRGGALLLLAAGATACGDAAPVICARPETQEPRPYMQGAKVTDGVYQSASWDGPLLFYPAGAYYRFTHNLECIPYRWEVYLSFSEHGLADESSLALATGNQAELRAVDEQTITILNGSCAEYWMLLVAEAEYPCVP